MKEKSEYQSFKDFWPDYLREHQSLLNRRLHVLGVALGIVNLVLFILTKRYVFILIGFLAGYGCAWVGHFIVEKNRPATFQRPLWSLMGDFLMAYLTVTGQIDGVRQKLKI